MVTEAGKELLRNTINTAKFHNRILEENEMWKQWELECGLTMMVSDDDIIKRIKKNHQCSKHRKRDKSRSRERSHSRREMAKIKQGAGSSNDRWDHSGFAELYPDAAVPEKYPSTSFSSLDRHTKKKKKKSHHRSVSSDEEIWEEFKRPVLFWNKERTLRLIELLREAPALWNINYPGYRDQSVKLKETKRIASVFRIDEDEIVTKIALLINEFHEEHKKMTIERLNGTSTKFLENEWFAYKHLTFLKNTKNERYGKTVKNNLRKGENSQWVDSSDSYSDSEDERPQPIASQSSKFIKSKVQDEKREVHGKKASYTSTNLRSYSDQENEASRLPANQSSYCFKSKVQDEKVYVHGKKFNYMRYMRSNLLSCSESEDETYQSSKYTKSKVLDGKRDVHEKEANYIYINLSSNTDSEDETHRPSANQSRKCFKSKVQDEKEYERGKKVNYTGTNLPYVQAYMAQKDSFSVYGEIVAHRMRKAKKSSKAVARAEIEIDAVLRKYETGFFDSPEDTFK